MKKILKLFFNRGFLIGLGAGLLLITIFFLCAVTDYYGVGYIQYGSNPENWHDWRGCYYSHNYFFETYKSMPLWSVSGLTNLIRDLSCSMPWSAFFGLPNLFTLEFINLYDQLTFDPSQVYYVDNSMRNSLENLYARDLSFSLSLLISVVLGVLVYNLIVYLKAKTKKQIFTIIVLSLLFYSILGILGAYSVERNFPIRSHIIPINTIDIGI